MKQAIVNGTVFDGEREFPHHGVLLEDGRITAVLPQEQLSGESCETFDLGGATLIPGFIDLQVNGGGGVLFNNVPSVATLRTMGEAHRRYGTTGFLPTLITDRFEVMRAAVAAVRQALAEGVPGVLGIHLEGPFLNPQRRGAHDAGKFCLIDEEGFDIITSLVAGRTLVTIAPELTDIATIARIVEAGVIVCAGHTAADYEQTRAALDAGVSGFTHLYNAMTPMHSREPGVVGAALEDENSWFGIIADGHHSHPAAFKAAVRAKQPGGAVLVSDAMPTVGSTQKSFELDGEIIHAVEGRCMNAAGALAGSDLDMLSAVNNAARYAALDWYEAVRMATLYPARALGLDDQLGAIKPGYRASMIALAERREVVQSWIDGVPANSAP